MDIQIRRNCAGIDWKHVATILNRVGMAHHEPAVHQKAFEASYSTIFVYHMDELIGFGRAISDGAYQAAIYDCAVVPEFQGRGIGKTIVSEILSAVSHCNVILYASPGKEGFYETLGFRKMKTGMARFIRGAAMQARGFTD